MIEYLVPMKQNISDSLKSNTLLLLISLTTQIFSNLPILIADRPIWMQKVQKEALLGGHKCFSKIFCLIWTTGRGAFVHYVELSSQNRLCKIRPHNGSLSGHCRPFITKLQKSYDRFKMMKPPRLVQSSRRDPILY